MPDKQPSLKPRRKRLLFVAPLLAVVLLPLGMWGWATWKFEQIPTFSSTGEEWVPSTTPTTVTPVETTRPAPTGTETYLLFSTGVTGLTSEEAEVIGVNDADTRGKDTLTDVIVLATINHDDRTANILSVPRDLWIPEHQSRINSLYEDEGPQALSDTVTNLTGIGVDHLVQVDMAAFVSITDLVGGVSLTSSDTIRDRKTGLFMESGKCETFDGKRALSLTRSRYVERQILDGSWVPDGDADFGRVRRQQAFLYAAMTKLAQPDLITKIPALFDTAKGNLVVDDALTLSTIMDVARTLSGAPTGVNFYQVPSTPTTIGRASVLSLNKNEAHSLFTSLGGLPSWTPPNTASGPPDTAMEGNIEPPPEAAEIYGCTPSKGQGY